MKSVALALLTGTILVGSAPLHAETLDQAIAEALVHAPALAAARAREDAADARIDAARAQHMPEAVVSGQVGTGWIDPQGFFGLTARDVTPATARVSVTLPLFTGGRIAAAEQQAKGGAAAAAEQTHMTALNLRIAVVQAYSGVLTARQLINRYDKLIAALDEAVRQARLKFQAGEGTSTEIAQAEARRAEATAGLADAQGRLASASGQLTSLVGSPVVVDAALPQLPALPTSEDDAVARALAGNPQLRAAKNQMDVARASVAGARAEHLPTIGAYAEGATVNDEFFPGYKTNSAAVGLRAQWRFFDGGRTSAGQRGADAALRAARADADAARLAVEQQAITGFNDMRAARAVLAAADARALASDEALRGTRLEVQAGAKPQLALLDAEREALEASASQVDAQGRLLVAAYRLRAVTGMD